MGTSLNNKNIFSVIRPNKIRVGDCIGIVAPSFFIEKFDQFKAGVSCLAQTGYDVKISKSAFRRFENTTAPAKTRALEIEKMFIDTSVKGVICTDGGTRCIELLKFLNPKVFYENNKLLMGFSDITHLLNHIYFSSGLVTIHGPDLINGFGNSDNTIQKETVQNFTALIENDWNNYELLATYEVDVWREGYAKGVLIGGWIEAVVNLAGTPSLPLNSQIILFIEAVDLEMNKIQLQLSGLFHRVGASNIKGLIIGRFKNCIEHEYADCIPDFKDFILNLTDSLGLPIIANCPFGHLPPNKPLPVGAITQLDTSADSTVICSLT